VKVLLLQQEVLIHNNWDLLNNSFTIEMWVRSGSNATAQNYPLINHGTSGDYSWKVDFSSADQAYNHWTFQYSTNGSSWNNIISGDRIDDDRWHHIAVVRDSTYIKTYTDGKLKTIHTHSGATFHNSPDTLKIAQIADNSRYYTGDISNVRVVNGTAVYTSSFRPPTEPLTDITNTVLLMCNNSSVTGSTNSSGETIHVTGDPTASTDSPFDDPAGFVFGESGSENVIKCGSFVGNGSSDGPEINLGFEPQWVLTKNADISDVWYIYDSMRGIVSDGDDPRLSPNSNGAESSGDDRIDVTPTGFKINNDNGDMNGNGNTIIYLAIRRSDSLVQKPVEVGTDVFTMDVGNGSTTIPCFDSAFPVDFALMRKPSSSEDWYTGFRLTGPKFLKANDNNAEGTQNDWVFDSNVGWIKGTDQNSSYQSWMWKRGHGLDISLYVGTGSSSIPAVIRHGLGKKPEMVWFKKRNESDPWIVYHHGLLGGVNPETSYVKLNYDSQQNSGTSGYAYDSTAVTLTTTWDQVNDVNIKHLCVLFCSVDGISKVGSYTGTGSSGNAQNIGFQPRFLVVKRVDSSGSWNVFDSLRTPSNPFDRQLQLDSPNQQDIIDKVTVSSTGWSFTDLNINENGSSYIYYAHV